MFVVRHMCSSTRRVDDEGEGGVGLLVNESDLSNVCRHTGKHAEEKEVNCESDT